MRMSGRTRRMGALLALCLALACLAAAPARAAEEGTVLYRQETPDTVAAVRQVWPANTTAGWLRTCEIPGQGVFRQIDYYNNRNATDGGLPEGESMSIEIPAEIPTAGYGDICLTFQYARCPGNSDVDVASTGQLQLYASTDGGATWSANCAGIRQFRMIGVGRTSNGLDAYVYQVECEDLTDLVRPGAVIDRLKLMPYGDCETHLGATRLHWIEVTGWAGAHPDAVERPAAIPDPAEGGVQLYQRTATSGVTANRKAWIGNSGTTWMQVCLTDEGESLQQMCWFNNPNSTGGLPAGGFMTIDIPVNIPTAGYEEICLSFQYGRCPGNTDVNIGEVDRLEVYASTDGGETWSEGFAGMRRYALVGAGVSDKTGKNLETYIYQVESGDIAALVSEGAVIDRLRLRPYGEYQPCYGATRIHWMEVTGYPQTRPDFENSEVRSVPVPEEILRSSVVKKMYRVIDVPWFTDAEMITYNSNGYSNESHTQYYKPGFLYRGPAYARPIRTTWEMLLDNISEEGRYLGGYTDETAVGMDCIIIVSAGLNEVSKSRHHTWSNIMNDPGLTLLGGVVNATHCANSQQVVQENGDQAILRGYAAMQPGDYALHQHPDENSTLLHIRLASLPPKVVYLDDGVTIDADSSEAYLTETGGYIIYYWQKPDGTVVATSNKDPQGYQESHPTYTYLYGTSCRKDKVYTFRQLLDQYYVAYTLDEYAAGAVYAPEARAVSATGAKELTDKGYAALYLSNWRIAELKTVLKNADTGEVLWTDIRHPKAGTRSIRFRDDGLDQLMKELPNGHYRLTADITAGSGVGGPLPVTRAVDRAFSVFPSGDMSQDGKVNAKDVVLLQRFLAGGYGAALDADAADLTGDGKVNGKDVVLLQRFVAGGYGVVL